MCSELNWGVRVSSSLCGTHGGDLIMTDHRGYRTYNIMHTRRVYPRSQASMPSFCCLPYEKRGEGLDGFIMWCMPLLTSHTVASHDRSSSNRTRRTNWTERTNWEQREQTQMWADWTWCQQQHASRDKSIQAFPPLFVLQATKAGRGGLGTRLRRVVTPASSVLMAMTGRWTDLHWIWCSLYSSKSCIGSYAPE